MVRNATMRAIVLAAALIAGASYYANHWIGAEGGWVALWKGAGVGLLALWAALSTRGTDGRLIAAALAFGALGDVLLETHGLIVGAIAFLVGHVTATILYLRGRVGALWRVPLMGFSVTVLAAALADTGLHAPGILLYAFGLGAMACAAWISRFPRRTVALGAALFVLSDLLLFARMGMLAGSPLPGLLIWPTYFAGQALIGWGVVTSLGRRM
jgi:uncharacterized membrane protein YhhN